MSAILPSTLGCALMCRGLGSLRVFQCTKSGIQAKRVWQEPKMIALLLILILCVLLFGAGAVLAGFGWLAVIVVALTLLYFLIIAAAGIFVSARNLAPEASGAVAA